MGNCISAPKESEHKQPAQGKPTTNQANAVSPCFVYTTVTVVNSYRKVAITYIPVSHALSSTVDQAAQDEAKQEVVSGNICEALIDMQNPKAGAAKPAGHAGVRKQGVAHSVLGKETEVDSAFANNLLCSQSSNLQITTGCHCTIHAWTRAW